MALKLILAAAIVFCVVVSLIEGEIPAGELTRLVGAL